MGLVHLHKGSGRVTGRTLAGYKSNIDLYLLPFFGDGLREGEQIGLKPRDIDWTRKLLHVRRAITMDENGKRIEGRTKNRYSRRTIKLIPAMFDALKAQKEIHDRRGGKYFFCTPDGTRVCPSNLRKTVWIPAFKKAGLAYREIKQTRHSFATVALSCGESPLWIEGHGASQH